MESLTTVRLRKACPDEVTLELSQKYEKPKRALVYFFQLPKERHR